MGYNEELRDNNAELYEILNTVAELPTASGGQGLTQAQVEQIVDAKLADVEIEETDPTVPDWAKQSTKPTYNYSEIQGTPTLFDGDYNKLRNKPTLFDGDYNSLSNTPTLFDGDYNNLKNKPLNDGKFSTSANANATGWKSAAFGAETSAEGDYSIADGYDTLAKGTASHAGGAYTRANYDYQHVVGRCNDNNEDDLFEVGNGYVETNGTVTSIVGSNAFRVLKDGRAKVHSAAIDDDDVVRKIDLSSLVSSDGVGRETIYESESERGKICWNNQTTTITVRTDGSLIGARLKIVFSEDGASNYQVRKCVYIEVSEGRGAYNGVQIHNWMRVIEDSVSGSTCPKAIMFGKASIELDYNILSCKVECTILEIVRGETGVGYLPFKTVEPLADGSYADDAYADIGGINIHGVYKIS